MAAYKGADVTQLYPPVEINEKKSEIMPAAQVDPGRRAPTERSGSSTACLVSGTTPLVQSVFRLHALTLSKTYPQALGATSSESVVSSCEQAVPLTVSKRPKLKHVIRDKPLWQSKCNDIVGKMKNSKHSSWFLVPVTPDVAPDYEDVIVTRHGSYPMDLNTLQKKLNAGEYQEPQEFATVRLLWIMSRAAIRH